MPVVEQLIYGVDPDDKAAGRKILEKSPGLGANISAEIGRLCEGWGQPPPLGLQRPVLMSFPLQERSPNLKGRLYAVIRLPRGTGILYHAIVLPESQYATFEYNPYAVAACNVFEDTWNGEQFLTRRQIQVPDLGQVIDPPPGREDLGIVDEALRVLLTRGKIKFPLEQAVPQSDRCLALLIAVQPRPFKRDLRFASFAPSEANNYTLFARETQDCAFAGWRRLLLAEVIGELPDRVKEYTDKIEMGIKAGDMAEIMVISAGGKLDKPPASPRSRPEPRAVMPNVEVPRQVPKRHPSSDVPRPQAPTSWGLKKEPLRTGNRAAGRSAGSGRRVPKVVLSLLTLLLVAFAGSLGMDHMGWGHGLDWAGKLNFCRNQVGLHRTTKKAPSLLEVVNVGAVYSRLHGKVSSVDRSNAVASDRVRTQVLNTLQAEAAEPLLQQIAVICKVAAQGIQQGNRPDRETERMGSLSWQGVMIEQEVHRLEVAWYSLANEVDWADLTELSDQAVTARRDSLQKRNPAGLREAGQTLGTAQVREDLRQACRQIQGMADLVTLFQQEKWDPDWERSLINAAGKVAPTASPMTRAYRNCAFALVKLKGAERAAATSGLAFSSSFGGSQWLTPRIREALPILRKHAGGFMEGEAPALVAATLAWYKALSHPEALTANWSDADRYLQSLSANGALNFDPAVYTDYLDRARFEGLETLLRAGANPVNIPDRFFVGADTTSVLAFRSIYMDQTGHEDWLQISLTQRQEFLARWANHLAARSRTDQENRLQNFDAAWGECMAMMQGLQGQITAGIDWTEAWGRLHVKVEALLEEGIASSSLSEHRVGRLVQLADLSAALLKPMELHLIAVTVRLEAGVLAAAGAAIMEIRADPGGKAWYSAVFPIGPAAPAGWAGTGNFDCELSLAPGQSVQVRILNETGEKELLTAEYPSLAEGGGPGPLMRRHLVEGGSVLLRCKPDFWKKLELPNFSGDLP